MKVGVLPPTRFEDPAEFLADARAMEAAGADSIWLEEGDGYDPMLVLAAIAAVTGNLRLGLIRAANPLPNVELERPTQKRQLLSRHRVITDNQRWRRVEAPADREAWARTLKDAAPDFDGVLVPLDPRLLDMLRNPEDAIDRSDLMLAQG